MPVHYKVRPTEADPLTVFAAATWPRAIFMGQETLVHEGVVHAVTASGAARSAVLRRDMQPPTWEGPDAGAPRWSGGLAFRFDHDGSGMWSGFPAATFRLPKRQWLWSDRCYEASTDTGAMDVPKQRPGTMAASTSQAEWRDGVEHALEQIVSGDVTKVVLARCRRGDGQDPVALLKRLRQQEPHGTAFCIEPIPGHAIVGVTPERLVRLRDGMVTSHALAGSRPSGDAAGDLLASQKDVLEHELVAAFLRERLAEAGVKDVRQERRRVLPLRHVQHLETPIKGSFNGHILDIVQHLHPTPAVCGTPRSASLELIRKNETFPRGWYAGTLGWITADGQGDLAVALRCALVTPEATWQFAGAGIVAGSDPEQEWQETESKMRILEAP